MYLEEYCHDMLFDKLISLNQERLEGHHSSLAIPIQRNSKFFITSCGTPIDEIANSR